ncbi:bifunctional phosphoribosyl-AMP cyclohydrolase/phosphoribosyl-ATP diphosphatase HisIE [Legionella dresdenensis]|uniref:Histidine biosynthesis bifunctional protein HisIE n=1 Tax=Legionella dresdenensis TaxID=450200 RepID=A0ABV8CC98_9GAMM
MNIDFDKANGLVPVCVQDYQTMQVLMIGYMNQAALNQTLETGLVTFFSRSKNRLWVKGESSSNFLKLICIDTDCDNDGLLITAQRTGPVCHQGTASCFSNLTQPPIYWFGYLLEIIAQRSNCCEQDSYTSRLLAQGIKRIAQKVGEEGVEVGLAAVAGDNDELAAETVDLLYHVLVLLNAKNINFQAVAEVIRQRSCL